MRSGKGSFSEKNQKLLIEVHYVSHLRVQVVSFKMILSHLRCVFLVRVIHSGVRKMGDHVDSFAEKAKIINRGSLRSTHESAGSKLQHDPYLISVECS